MEGELSISGKEERLAERVPRDRPGLQVPPVVRFSGALDNAVTPPASSKRRLARAESREKVTVHASRTELCER